MVSPEYVRKVWINQLTRDFDRVMDLLMNKKVKNFKNLAEEGEVAKILEKLELHYERFAADSPFGNKLKERNRHSYAALIDVMSLATTTIDSFRRALKSGKITQFEKRHVKTIKKLTKLLKIENTDKYFGPYSMPRETLEISFVAALLIALSVAVVLYPTIIEHVSGDIATPGLNEAIAGFYALATGLASGGFFGFIGSVAAEQSFPVAVRSFVRFKSMLQGLRVA